jgi:UDP-N-acetyl-D-glucosamine dehydrogenase
VQYYDPYIPAIKHEEWELTSVPDLIEGVKQADCVVIITDHTDIDYRAVADAAVLVFDTRNAMRRAGVVSEKIARL